MNFKTHNEKHISAVGTWGQGCIEASYDDLVRVFGAPCCLDNYKTDAEWLVEFDNGYVATIYNYKDGRNYLGDDGLPTEQIRDWHIGGASNLAVGLVQQALSS